MSKYISNELIHFIGRKLENDSQRYNLLKTILQEGNLSASGGKGINPTVTTWPHKDYFDKITATSVCFCDIPLCDISSHINKYNGFGIAFTKSYLCALGVNPVFYYIIDQLEEGSGLRFNKKLILDEIIDIGEKICEKYNVSEDLFTADITNELGAIGGKTTMSFKEWYGLLVFHILSHIKPMKFADNLLSRENYYTEREWRSLGDVKFGIKDVYRILIPKTFANTFYSDFSQVFKGQLTFSDDL
jgi:hypothetical protein